MMTNAAHKKPLSPRTRSHIPEASTEVRNLPFANSVKRSISNYTHTITHCSSAAWCKCISAGHITWPSGRMHILRSPMKLYFTRPSGPGHITNCFIRSFPAGHCGCICWLKSEVESDPFKVRWELAVIFIIMRNCFAVSVCITLALWYGF